MSILIDADSRIIAAQDGSLFALRTPPLRMAEKAAASAAPDHAASFRAR